VEKVHKALNVKLPLAELFKKPKIRGLSGYIKGLAEDKYVSVEAAERKEYYALSSAQKRFYVLQRMDKESTAYNLPSIDKLEGKLDRQRLEKAFKALINRHESLRTSFEMKDGESIQGIHNQVDFEIEDYDLATGGKIHHSSFIKTPNRSFIRPFDLAHAPLFRIGLIKLPEVYLLMFDMHHIVTDGFSIGIFIKDLMAFYRGTDVPPLRLQYKDFAQWQQHRLTSGKLKKQEEYWLNHFSGQLPVLNMPYDYPRPPVRSYEGDVVHFHFEEELTRDLNRLARETGATLYIILLAIYNVLLSKYTRQEEIIVGATIAGRNHEDLKDIIGLMLETLAIRNYPEGDKTFLEFLAEVKETSLKAYENQGYPFRELVQQVWDENDRSRNPLFDTMLIVQNIDRGPEEPKIGELRVLPYEGDFNKVSKLDLTLEARERDDEIFFNLEYCTKLFKKETMERFFTLFKKIALIVVENEEIKLKDIETSHDLVTAASNVYENVKSDFEF